MPAAPSRASVIAGKAFVIVDAIDGTGAVLRQVESNFFQTGRRLQMLGTSVFTKALMASVPSALSTRIFTQFDDSMRRVEARATGTAEEMAGLRDQARALGMNSAFSARQVALLMDTLGQLKFTRADIGAMTHPILMLGRTAGSNLNPEGDIQNAANLVGQAIMMYGLEAKDAARVADIFTQAANESNFALDDLIIAMATAGPVARQYGMSLEETLATMMVMRDVSIDASVAGTGLRNIFLKASDKKAVDDFNKMMMDATGSTIEFVDAAGNLQRPVDILKAFFNLTQKLGTARKGELLAELFGLRAITPATAVASNIRGFEESLAALTGPESIGATSRAYKTMESGIGGAARRAGNAFEGLGLTIGETLAGAVTAVGAAAQKLVMFLNAWVKENKTLVIVINLLVAGLFPLAAAIFLVGTAFKLVFYVLHPITVLVGTLISVFRLLIAFTVALSTSLITLAVHALQLVARGFMMVVGVITSYVIPAFIFALRTVMSFIVGGLIALGIMLVNNAAAIAAWATLVWSAYRQLMKAFAMMIVDFLKPMIRIVVLWIAKFSLTLAALIGQLGLFLLKDFGFKVFSALASFIIVGMGHIATILLGMLGSLLSLTFTAIASAIGTIITTAFMSLLGLLTGALLFILPVILSLLTGLIGVVSVLATALWSMVTALATGIYNVAKPAVVSLINELLKLRWTVAQAMQGISSALMKGDYESAMKIGVQSLKIIWMELKNYILDIWDGVLVKIMQTFQQVKIVAFRLYADLLRFNAKWNPAADREQNLLDAIDLDLQALDMELNPIQAKKKDPREQFERQGEIFLEKMKLLTLMGIAKLKPSIFDIAGFDKLPEGVPFGAPPAEIQNLVRDGVSTGISGGKALDAMQQGSVEAAKAAYENEMNRRENIQAQQLKAAEEANNKLGNIERNTRNLTNLQPTVVGVV